MSAQPLPADLTVTARARGGVPTAEITIDGIEPRHVVLYFHGGVYVIGDAFLAAELASQVGRRTQARVVSVDYRLAPEHPYPAAVDDALAAYEALLADGIDPADIVVAGESAGGGLAIAALIDARVRGLPLPAAVFVMSPYVDLTLSGASMETKGELDPLLSREALQARVTDYTAGQDAALDLISPVFADLSGLPPLLIQAGTHEVLLDDAVRLAGRAAAADVEVVLDVTPGCASRLPGVPPDPRRGGVSVGQSRKVPVGASRRPDHCNLGGALMASLPVRDPVADHLLTPQNAALLLIDYQPPQFSAVSSIDPDLLRENIVSVVKTANAFGLPIVHSTINVATGRSESTVPELATLLEGAPPVDRTSTNAWEDADFLAAVRATGRRKLILCALWTEICMAFPALDAIREGYEVYPVVDAIGGTSEEAHRAGLERVVQAGGQPVSWVALAVELQRDWAREATVADVIEIVLTERLLKV